MKRKSLSITLLSALFAVSTLSGCTKDELDSMNNKIQHKLDELQAEIDEIQNQITTLREEMEAEIEENKTSFQNQIDAANAEIASLTTDLKELVSKHNEDKASIEEDYNSKLSALTTTLNNNVSTLQSSINATNEQITTLKNKHDQDVASIQADYNQKINKLSEDDSQARADLQEELENQINALDEELEQQVASLQSSINSNSLAITNLVNKHNEDVTNLTKDYEDKIAALGDSEASAREELTTTFNNQLAELNSTLVENITNLQTSITANSNAIASLTTKHSQDIANVTSEFNQKLLEQEQTDSAAREALKTELNNNIASLNQQLTSSISALETSVIQDIASLNDFKTQYASDVAALQADYNQKISALDEKYDTQVAAINTQIVALQNSVTSLTNTMNSTISNIQADYTNKINELTGRVSDLEEVETHTVSFEIYGDYELDIPSQVVEHGEKASRPYISEDLGYSYSECWYSWDGIYLEPWYFLSSPVTEDITLITYIYAKSFDLKLNDNKPGSYDYYHSSQVTSGQNFSCPIPTYEDHVFEGWYYGDTKVTDNQGNSLAPFNFAAVITLTAHWESIHDGQSVETAFTIDELLSYIGEFTPGQWSDSELYVKGTFSTGTTYDTSHGSFTGYAKGYESGSASPFKVYSALLDSSITGDYAANGCLDNADFVVRGYATFFQGSDSSLTYEIAFDKNKTSPYILELTGATEQSDLPITSILVDEALSIINGLSDNEETTSRYAVYGYVTEVVEAWNSTYGNITFKMGTTSSATETLTVFRAKCDQSTGNAITQGVLLRITCTLQKYSKGGVTTPETKGIYEINIY